MGQEEEEGSVCVWGGGEGAQLDHVDEKNGEPAWPSGGTPAGYVGRSIPRCFCSASSYRSAVYSLNEFNER